MDIFVLSIKKTCSTILSFPHLGEIISGEEKIEGSKNYDQKAALSRLLVKLCKQGKMMMHQKHPQLNRDFDLLCAQVIFSMES